MRFLSSPSWLLIIGLTGCTADPASQALEDAFHQIRAERSSSHTTSELNPNFRYLRVQIGNREVFMALGYVDKDSDGPIEVWYSGTGEVLRLRDGRLIGATMSIGTDWLSVSFTHLPRWDKVGSQATFERSRDISPGYQYGIKEKMIVRLIPQPNDTQLQLIPASSLTWFEERAVGNSVLPPARYGVNMTVDSPQVVYAEQCLSKDLCFSWQRWTAVKESAH